MSAEDRAKWDARYQAGAYEERIQPSAFLAACAHRLPRRGNALDLGCGAGRNAMFLAKRGLTVDAADISAVALARGRERAGALPIRWLQRDLELGFEPERCYDVIVNRRYVHLALLAELAASLRPGGLLVVEQHLQHAEADAGPSDPAFRVAPGALRRLAANLAIERYEEGVLTDPDARVVALARLLARHPAADRATAGTRHAACARESAMPCETKRQTRTAR